MNIDEIKRNAPEGSTHYRYDLFSNLRYLKIDKTGGHLWCDYDSGDNRWRKVDYIDLESLDFYMEIDEVKPLN
ncbi:hypothetical protein [Acinetobacter phage Ab65]|nr:hypothetical protein [Acinetobacter phage Ab69]WMC00623.1 hypothetical protein [Acinetobacter phage Ab65]